MNRRSCNPHAVNGITKYPRSGDHRNNQIGNYCGTSSLFSPPPRSCAASSRVVSFVSPSCARAISLLLLLVRLRNARRLRYELIAVSATRRHRQPRLPARRPLLTVTRSSVSAQIAARIRAARGVAECASPLRTCYAT